MRLAASGRRSKFCASCLTADADGGGTIDEEEFEALSIAIQNKEPLFP